MAEAKLEGKTRPAHVLALPFPFQGHINPLLHLSRKLAADGVTVSFINVPHYHSRIAPSLQPLLDSHCLPIRLLSLSDTYAPPPDLRVRRSFELCLRDILASMETEVEHVMKTLMQQDPLLPLTCVLADIRIPFAQRLADKFSIARSAFWTQSAACFLYHTAVAEGFHIPTDELAIIDCIPGVPAHTMSDTPTMLRQEIVGDFVFDFITKPFLQIHEALCVVINTFDSLEAEAIEAMRGRGLDVFPIGPLLAPAYFDNSASSSEPSPKSTEEASAEERHICLKWLDACKPASVLYISFGTLVSFEEAELKELAIGVEASGQSFLWSLRPDMVAGNPRAFMEAFTERTKHRGLVVPWVPQIEVLSHSSVGGFLTHCGWNSSLESMCIGVPMIGWPKISDQKLNMKCLVDCWKVCLAILEGNQGQLRRDQAERNVRALFAGVEAEELRSAAENMRSALACTMASNGSSLSYFKQLVLKLVVEGEVPASI